jgi:hypothetical protein
MKGQSLLFNEGVRISSDDSGLLIEITDYHAKPLKLTWTQVRDFARSAGLSLDEGSERHKTGATP